MINYNKFLFLLFFLIVFIAVEVHAWDGKRKGFLLGFGIGPGSITRSSYDADASDYLPKRIGASGANFKIGYSPTDTIQVYLTGKWASYDCSDTCGTKMSRGIGAAGVSYYFWSQLPTLFCSGGLGYSGDGLGVFGGAGFEFFPHIYFEFDVLWGENDDQYFETSDKVSYLFTVNVLGY